jgi:hypothetical protein
MLTTPRQADYAAEDTQSVKAGRRARKGKQVTEWINSYGVVVVVAGRRASARPAKICALYVRLPHSQGGSGIQYPAPQECPSSRNEILSSTACIILDLFCMC